VKRRGLVWQVFPCFVAVVAATVALTWWSSSRPPRGPGEPETQVALEHAASGRVAVAGALSVLLAAVASLWLSRRLAAPILAMRAAAERLARGDVEVRLQGPDSLELASLAASLNAMATELAGRIQAVTRQKEEAEAILASMAEGVIALSPDGVVLHLNQASAGILGQERARLVGVNLRQVVRNPALYDILDRTFAGTGPAEGDVVLRDRGLECHLQVRGSRLSSPGAAGQTGAVLVLNDVTRLKRLEALRRDFAANVSHELRTPITSIKGFVETLLDGALDDRADAERFLQIIRQQTDRLNSLIADLLALAGLERDSEAGAIALACQPLRPALTDAVAGRRAAADARQARVTVDCAADLTANLNPGLFRQAIINLLDNAIAYSEPGTPILVTASRTAGDLRIAVVDQGRGIAPEHLERIFERFYRVDKARNRTAGGTGLGLAIVKHVVQAHKGRIEVASTPGKGSTFTLILPLP
jgi:two-component system phosphate regulon sensor histidine kinase PhoR